MRKSLRRGKRSVWLTILARRALLEEEVQRRVEVMIRASRRPPIHRKNVPPARREAKRKKGKLAKPSPSEPSESAAAARQGCE
jgi:hypothetical protein